MIYSHIHQSVQGDDGIMSRCTKRLVNQIIGPYMVPPYMVGFPAQFGVSACGLIGSHWASRATLCAQAQVLGWLLVGKQLHGSVLSTDRFTISAMVQAWQMLVSLEWNIEG